VSLDLYFLDRDDRRTWIEAMADLELVGDDQRFSAADLEVWARLVDALAPVLPGADADAGDESRVLDDEASGISFLFATDEVSVSIPVDDLATADPPTLELLTRVVTVVEAETGLVAYDPLADQPFLPGRRSSGGGAEPVRHLFGDPGFGPDAPA
jgi:hypothetical protein